MSKESRLEGLTAAEADEIEKEWRQLDAINIQRTAEGNGKFTMTCTFPGSPFATKSATEVLTAIPVVSTAATLTTKKTTNFSNIEDEYRRNFELFKLRPEREAAVLARCKTILKERDRYEALGSQLGIPWTFIGIVHSLESGCNFQRHLHNGDPLSARTVQVPTGRPEDLAPPFTWEQSAKDALRMKHLAALNDWGIATTLFRWESYNGMGYRTRGLPSPYLWSFSDLYRKGKFVADHKFDPEAVSQQPGAAVLLRTLQSMN